MSEVRIIPTETPGTLPKADVYVDGVKLPGVQAITDRPRSCRLEDMKQAADDMEHFLKRVANAEYPENA